MDIMKYTYRIICNWLFRLTKSLIKWCVLTKRWKLASKIVDVRTTLAEAYLCRLDSTNCNKPDTNELINIIAENTRNSIIIHNMEITVSDALHTTKKR